ncbi:MAG: c-type cytochrome [Ignavibacteria bacterium]|jgi:cytochrome c
MKKIKIILVLGFIMAALFALTACGGDSNDEAADEFSNYEKKNESGLTDFQLKHGFGPIKKEIKLNPIDPALAKEGEKIFESKCATCHKLDERYTGPAQRDVLQRVTPEFFINMVLNPEENLEKHPHSKKMFMEYMQKMTNQNVSIKDALALLEYFRVLDEELTKNKSN